MTTGRTFDAALRRCALGATLVHDIDAVCGDDGVRVGSDHGPVLPWDVLAPYAWPDADSVEARYRIARVLRAAIAVDELLATGGWSLLEARLRLVALPAGHIEHPGAHWARSQVHGGVLDLGPGVLGLMGDADRSDPLPAAVASIWGHRMAILLENSWPGCLDQAERMADLAIARLARDEHLPTGRRVLRSVGGCDVLTLLSTRTLRRHLSAGDGTGMRAVAAPIRDRGWFDLARIDPAFVGAAWMATDEPERGLSRAVLVTADGVTVASADGDAAAAGVDLPHSR